MNGLLTFTRMLWKREGYGNKRMWLYFYIPGVFMANIASPFLDSWIPLIVGLVLILMSILFATTAYD